MVKMFDKLPTALTISPITYLFKAFRTLGCRSFDVEGVEILLRALKEPEPTADGEPVQRRGIVTSEYSSRAHFNRLNPRYGGQPQTDFRQSVITIRSLMIH